MTDKPVLWHNPEDIYDITTIYDPEYHQGWTPLYTSPPSVEAAIEATKAKYEKKFDEVFGELIEKINGGMSAAAAIRSMK